MPKNLRFAWMLTALLALAPPALAGAIRTPEEFFGFEIGADGELARYPRVLEYFQHLAASSDRINYEQLGESTEGHPYVLLKVSSPANLGRMDRLVEITNRLADPRGLSEAEAEGLAREGRPFYLLFATIHATEVANGQAIIEIVHRLATDTSPEILEILEGAVLLLVPSQNPDGQIKIIDHWYAQKDTGKSRQYPDLYHRYVGHDNNRDWFMFTQVETRLAVEKLHDVYKPQLTHDMHQMGPTGARIFVPPFVDPYDPNIHPILYGAQAQIGLAMAGALVAEGKAGVSYGGNFDLWTPARQYMVYHGQPRILTEIASARLADPFLNPDHEPLGPQQPRWNFPMPYRESAWRLDQAVDYGVTATLAGLSHLAKYRTTWLSNFHKIHRDWVERDQAPYAFVISAEQRDPFEAYELAKLLDTAAVEIHRSQAAFDAGGGTYPEGSWIVKLAQPYGAWAKTMLEIQVYPDLRYYPGGPPVPPYDATGHTLGLLLGVDVDQIDEPLEVKMELVRPLEPMKAPMPDPPRWAYLVSPASNAGFLAVARLQDAGVPVYRSAAAFEVSGDRFAPGAWIVPPLEQARRILGAVSAQTGLPVAAADHAPGVAGYRLKQPTRIGLWKAADNIPAGWMKWLFEQYGFDHTVVASTDFRAELSDKYDVIVLPSGTSKQHIVEGLSPEEHDQTWEWAYGIGEGGWTKLAHWVRGGGTLVAVGTAVETARELLDLPIEKVLPERPRRRLADEPSPPRDEPRIPLSQAQQMLENVFQSPASLSRALQTKVVDPTSVFFCPGSLLRHEFDSDHPVAFGMPAEWPLFFRFDQAYRLRPSFDIRAEAVSRFPAKGDLAVSGWLLGDTLLHDQASTVAFRVGRGTVVTLGSQVAFRTQPRATFKLLFNAIYQGPAQRLSASELAGLGAAPRDSRPSTR